MVAIVKNFSLTDTDQLIETQPSTSEVSSPSVSFQFNF